MKPKCQIPNVNFRDEASPTRRNIGTHWSIYMGIVLSLHLEFLSYEKRESVWREILTENWQLDKLIPKVSEKIFKSQKEKK